MKPLAFAVDSAPRAAGITLNRDARQMVLGDIYPYDTDRYSDTCALMDRFPGIWPACA